MTVRRGHDWGESAALSPDALLHGDDRSAARAILEVLREHDMAAPTPHRAPFMELGLTGGDLHRSLGAPRHSEDELRNGAGRRFPIDVAVVRGDGGDGAMLEDCFVAHLVGAETRRIRRLFAHRTVVVMNATHRGNADLGPRAHPNDGLLDTTDGQLLGTDLLAAQRRMRTGNHLPHPMLATSRSSDIEFRFSRAATLELDGEEVGRVESLSVHCLPDAVSVVV